MRQNRFIATKDHLIMIAASNEVGDELWAGYIGYNQQTLGEHTANSIGFFVRGSANSFLNVSDHGEEWQPYQSAQAPLMLVRKNFYRFGVASTSEDTLFGSILERDGSLSGGLSAEILSQNLNNIEKQAFSSSETMNVERKCKVYQKRDIETFDYVYAEDLDINIIPDSEIEIEGA